MFRRMGCVGLFLVAASAASAADLPVKADPIISPELGYNWTGAYVGGFVGGAWGESDSFVSPGSGAIMKAKGSGVIGGVHIGYDWQLPNNVVWGLRLAVPVGSSVKDTVTDPGFPLTVTSRFEWAVLGTAHLGYAMGRWLPYIGGGVAFGEVKATGNAPGGPSTSSNTHVGFTGLAGIRYALNQRWWVALQYNYINWGSETYNFALLPGLPFKVGFESHSLVGLVSYRF